MAANNTDPFNGDILHTSVVLAGIALALVSVSPSRSLGPPLIFVTGALALSAGIRSVIEIVDRSGNRRRRLLIPNSPIALLFWCLVALAIAFAIIPFPEVTARLADFFELAAKALRAN